MTTLYAHTGVYQFRLKGQHFSESPVADLRRKKQFTYFHLRKS